MDSEQLFLPSMDPATAPAIHVEAEPPKAIESSPPTLPAGVPKESLLEVDSRSALSIEESIRQCPVAVSSLDHEFFIVYPVDELVFSAHEDPSGDQALNYPASVEAQTPGPQAFIPKEKNTSLRDEEDHFIDLFAYYDLFPSVGQIRETSSSSKSLALAILQDFFHEPNHADDPSIKDLPSFTVILNEKVKEFINYFQNKADDFFSRGLARSHAYSDMMKKILREKNLPEELFYLALIESGYNPRALSRARASGIWQFMAQTARRFGLTVNKWVDERRDPEKSTYAAAEYLKNLYGMFNCWDLAAASYNAGEGKVMRAMKKAKSQDFWEISRHRYLKRETKRYVPMFHAAVMIAKDPQKYGFSTIDYHLPLLYDKVLVPPATSLAKIAKATETELSTIQELNPSITRGKSPPNIAQFEIRIPKGKKELFEKNFYSKASPNGKVHKVKSGETLSLIAKKHRIELEELCQSNSISPNSRIKPGMKILLPP